MKCKNRPRRGEGNIARTIQPAFNLHGPFPASCRNLTEGRVPRAEISLGAFRAFFYCLLAFADAPSEGAWSSPQDRRPRRAGAHTPPASPGAGLRTPRLQTCASPFAAPARQLGEHLPRPQPAGFLQPFCQIPSPPPCSREGAHGAPKSGATPLHPWGFPGRSLPHPPSLSSGGGGIKNQARLGPPGPQLSRGEKVERGGR